MASPLFNKLIIFSILMTLLAGFWLRTSNLEQYPPGISNDEAKNLIDSVYISQTGRTPFYEDEGRPEPINRIVAAFASSLYGNSIWAFRLTSAFLGLLAIATSFWVATQCFYNAPPQHRKLAGLFAMIALTVALGHITVTRSLYRAVPLTFFTLLAIGFTARGLRTYRWRDFFWIGVFVALGIYTYTSGFVVPIAFLFVGVILILFHRQHWRKWLPRLVFTGCILALLTSPIIYLLLTQPTSVLARASDVAESGNADFGRKIELMVGQFFTEGDENPQYNVADAPVIASILQPFFFIGIFALVIRLQQPASILILGLFSLNTIPVLLTDEITHGLRIYSEFAIIPLIIGASIVLLMKLAQSILKPSTANFVGLALVVLIGSYQVTQSRQIYITFWEDADTEWRKWLVYDRELTHNEWFFRSDRLVLTDWIKSQSTPLLIPVEELTRDAQRAMLMSHYPRVDSRDNIFHLPEDTQIVIPWSLEQGDFLDSSYHFALLDNRTITLLPPLTEEAHQQLLQNSDDAQEIENPNSNIPIVGKAFPVPDNIQLEYMQPTVSSEPIAKFNEELEIVQWYGNNTLNHTDILTYTIDWSVNRPVSHEYGMFAQLLTQDWQRITGVNDKLILRWLYPTIAWEPQQIISSTFELEIPDNLPAGAYRLGIGTWYVNGGRMEAESFIGDTVDDIATIGWIKVPQTTEPVIPDEAIEFDVILNNQFHLTDVTVNESSENQFTIELYWQSLVNRPNIDATVFVHAMDSEGAIMSQSDIRPWNGQYPTFIWDEDELVMTSHELELESIKDIRLVAGMYTQPNFTRLTAHQNNQPIPDDLIPLGALTDWINK